MVQEVIPVPEHRCRRYGSHLTRWFASSLSDQTKILLGTIHVDNLGAITAAAKCRS